MSGATWGIALRLAVALATLAIVLALGAGSVQASIDQLVAACSVKDALDDDTANGRTLPYIFCDDGTPSAGGRDPNPGADRAIAVPAAYAGATGLPAKDPLAAAAVPGNSAGDVALNANLSLPDPGKNPMPAGGYPLIVFMHGCCGGSPESWEADTIDAGTSSEKWHHSNAWFAARGYAVLTYGARGFVNSAGGGSTGEAQLDSTRFEINDYQHLAGQLADRTDLDPLSPGSQRIDPQKVVPVGGSYGGGWAWLALTDPTWRSPGGAGMRVAAVVAKYGWSNLVESLVPNGADRRNALPSTDPAAASKPLGFPKRSIVAGLFGTGVNPTGNHTTFPQAITEAFACLNSFDPYGLNPLCAGTLANELPRFINERSSYYQNDFFAGLAGGTVAPVPVFSAGTFTDPLFPTAEHRRMVDRLKAAVPGYPVQEYYGDFQHFTQNKRKGWSDLCGADHHVCTHADYPAAPGGGRNLNATPASLVREHGVNTRINRFIDHYAKPPANPGQGRPSFDVTAALQICEENASRAFPADEPGQRFAAARFADLAPNSLTVKATGSQSLPNKALPNLHALNADPVRYGGVSQIADICPDEPSPGGIATAGPGVATYDSAALPRDFTLIGQPRLTVEHSALGEPRQLNARLYDLFPDGKQVLVDRASYRLTAADVAAGRTVLDLRGAGWRFPKGHKLRIEIAQDDSPHIKFSNVPSVLELSSARLDLPVREASASLPGGVPGQPASDRDDGPSQPTRQASGEAAEDPGETAAATGSAGGGEDGDLPLTGLGLAALILAGAVLATAGVLIRSRLSPARAGPSSAPPR